MNDTAVDTSLQFRPENRLQKTWIPEGTEEYKVFKLTTQENHYLVTLLKKVVPVKPKEFILDVGGREGDIGVELQAPEHLHLVDPDPILKLPFAPGKYWNERIQDIELKDKYRLIICCHVLGYLGTQHVQDKVFRDLLKALAPGGTLALFYNTNTGYMGELLRFTGEILLDGHYDHFDEELLSELDPSEYTFSHKDVSFRLDYPSYEGLARCCWFLFGAKDQNIDGVAAKFLPKLKAELKEPTFDIDERVTLITRK